MHKTYELIIITSTRSSKTIDFESVASNVDVFVLYTKNDQDNEIYLSKEFLS